MDEQNTNNSGKVRKEGVAKAGETSNKLKPKEVVQWVKDHPSEIKSHAAVGGGAFVFGVGLGLLFAHLSNKKDSSEIQDK